MNYENFETSELEAKPYQSIKELKYRRAYNSDTTIIFLLDDLKENEMNDPRFQAMLKRPRLSNTSIFIISQDYFELSKRIVTALVIFVICSNQLSL